MQYGGSNMGTELDISVFLEWKIINPQTIQTHYLDGLLSGRVEWG